jgi:hypothetical protein
MHFLQKEQNVYAMFRQQNSYIKSSMQNKGYTVYMRTFVAAALFLLYMGALAPTAFAAGFARQPMFLSHSDVVEGQTVSIYTVVVNTANGPFVGKLKVHEDSASIGTASVSLGAGEAQTVAVTWKPSAGTHTIVADLFDANSALVESSQGQFAVAAKIVVVSDTTHNSSSNASSTFSLLSSTTPAVEPSTPVVQAISNVSPGVASAVSPAFAVVDAQFGHQLGQNSNCYLRKKGCSGPSARRTN